MTYHQKRGPFDPSFLWLEPLQSTANKSETEEEGTCCIQPVSHRAREFGLKSPQLLDHPLKQRIQTLLIGQYPDQQQLWHSESVQNDRNTFSVHLLITVSDRLAYQIITKPEVTEDGMRETNKRFIQPINVRMLDQT